MTCFMVVWVSEDFPFVIFRFGTCGVFRQPCGRESRWQGCRNHEECTLFEAMQALCLSGSGKFRGSYAYLASKFISDILPFF